MVVLLSAGGAVPVAGGETARPATGDLIVRIILRTLAFDRNMAARSDSTLRLAVVGGLAPGSQALDLAQALALYSHKTVAGRAYAYEVIRELPAGETFHASILATDDLSPEERRRAAAASTDRGILCFAVGTGTIEDGAAVEVAIRDERPEIVVHLVRAAQQGAAFESRFLSYVTTIGQKGD